MLYVRCWDLVLKRNRKTGSVGLVQLLRKFVLDGMAFRLQWKIK
ncbi:MAG: hypothetical protein K0R59_159 [Sphingobacterium sp.]|jgi:hypothetical protein|nr:hypothetical protein [Sphingobacterium sp.]